MGDIYMTKNMGRKLVKLVIGGLVLLLVVIGYGYISVQNGKDNLAEASQRARDTLVDVQRAGCERAKKDRGANAQGWRTAQTARMSAVAEDLDIPLKEVQHQVLAPPTPDDSFDLVAARRYNSIATELEERSRIDCAKAFPKESAS